MTFTDSPAATAAAAALRRLRSLRRLRNLRGLLSIRRLRNLRGLLSLRHLLRAPHQLHRDHANDGGSTLKMMIEIAVDALVFSPISG